MRYALAVLALLAGAAVWLLLRESAPERVTRRDEVSQEEARGVRGRAAEEEAAARDGANRRTEARDAQRPAPKCRLVYADGTPAAGIELKLALGRPLHTRIYRNGDYPEKVIWLLTRRRIVRTGPDGVFEALHGGRVVAYTEPESPAHLLAEIDPHQGDVIATRRAPVTGTLRAADGGSYDHWPVAAQRTRPEDWNTRYSKEKDSFVALSGELGIDSAVRVEGFTDEHARFELHVSPGRTWLLLGESGRLGIRDVLVPPEGLDLGEIVVRPPAPAKGNRALHGFVLDCAGQPRAEAEVRFWDGNVGEASHYIFTDDKGRFECGGLQSNHVIAWAMSSVTKRHVILPEQCSGTIRMPCNTPVTLTSPGPDEYQWLASNGGFHLFIRNGVFVGGGHLGGLNRIGLPPGSYHIIVLAPGDRILEADHIVAEGGRAQLEEFRDTTRG